ncbi:MULTISPECIES: type II toxin-antitoxin system VapC family toxin [unclassified Gordonia (in: high G+C Gram-positive bacteria)]|uniref:type II toxin-antitoxin system VapC family toxin n=1 Tax=unclassified Gordonia (in: high G+C Gram-positive bacteria) TaxID=2657482 RepID=UPI001F103008|nr:type II toxin-antitoxin system VapC family toxin [Gordonia sp. ABSL49_1]MCH5643395.1 type II toxin-antitoxin system VapC family toxin [Gordonia sp. ABSL49_1]
MIYLDTSAMTKLIVRETETPALVAWLGQHPDEAVATSALGRVELMRTAARDASRGIVERARELLDSIDVLVLTDTVMELAETIGAPTLRSLDAIHLASAAQLGDHLTALVAYDKRLLDGCADLNFPTASPTDETEKLVGD